MTRTAGRDIIVIGASAGGVQALQELARGLPHDLPAAVFVVVHTSPASPGILPRIIDRAGPLPCRHARDGGAIRLGRIYVAPPDHHLLVKRRHVRVTRGPRENGFRPAADPLFRTAARAYGPRVVGVVLSGGLDDGTEGLALIKRLGGVALAQDPAEAPFPSMPASAVQNVDVDHVLRVGEMPAVLTRLALEPVADGAERHQHVGGDMSDTGARGGNGEVVDVAESGDASLQTRDIPGPPSGLTCPECGGALWEMGNGKLVKYRCHVGHSYTPDGLVAAQVEGLEAALWSAMRALEESASLRRRMAKRSHAGSWAGLAGEYEKQAAEAEARADLIRKVLLSDKTDGPAAATEKAAVAEARARRRAAGGPVAPPAADKPANRKARTGRPQGQPRAGGNGNGNGSAGRNGKGRKAAGTSGADGKAGKATKAAKAPRAGSAAGAVAKGRR